MYADELGDEQHDGKSSRRTGTRQDREYVCEGAREGSPRQEDPLGGYYR